MGENHNRAPVNTLTPCLNSKGFSEPQDTGATHIVMGMLLQKVGPVIEKAQFIDQ